MRACFVRALLLLMAVSLCICAQEKGIEPEWDIRPVLKEIAAHAQRMVPVLEQIDAKELAKNGAPDTYIAQLNESKVQAKALATEAAALANSPDKLSADLATFFRMLSLEKTLFSIEEGIRKYWNPAVADLLNSQMAENGANRERFQRYILDLAATHEEECAVMDHEAQRCRGILAKQPNAASKTEKK
jgi:PAS domain-containing protein